MEKRREKIKMEHHFYLSLVNHNDPTTPKYTGLYGKTAITKPQKPQQPQRYNLMADTLE